MGVYSYALGLAIIGYDFWEKILGDLSLSKMQVAVHAAVRSIIAFLVPLAVYLGVFYIHLSILVNAGPHDNAMSSNFQASLEVVLQFHFMDLTFFLNLCVCVCVCAGRIEFHSARAAAGGGARLADNNATHVRKPMLAAQPRR